LKAHEKIRGCKSEFEYIFSVYSLQQFVLLVFLLVSGNKHSKDVAAACALVERAALLIDQSKPATAAASMAKCFASDMAVAANAVQIFGGSGYIRGFGVKRLYRDVKITQIYEGTSEVQRIVISRAVLA